MKKLLLLLIMISVLFSVGCGRKPGLPFEEIQQVPKDKGVVYFYMPKKNVYSYIKVTADNDEGIGIPLERLEKTRYIAYLAPKGENLFRVGKKKFVTIDVEPNESYFVRLTSYTIDFIFFVKYYTNMDVVDPTVGFDEILKTTSLVN